MFNVRLAGGHLYGKQLFTWLSLVMSLMASFVLSFFPLDVLDEIWDLIESVSEGFLTYSSITESDARQRRELKREAKLLIVVGFTTTHADCRIAFYHILYVDNV